MTSILNYINFDKIDKFQFNYLLGDDALSNIEIERIIKDNIVNYIHYFEHNCINSYEYIGSNYELEYIIKQYFYYLKQHNPYYHIELSKLSVDYIINNKEVEFYIDINYSIRFDSCYILYPKKLNHNDYLNQLEPRINRIIYNVLKKY